MERDEIGFDVYIKSMAKSTDDKVREILPLVRTGLKSVKGDILDLGGGGGSLSSALLSLQEQSDSGLTIVDVDPRMMYLLKEKFGNNPKVNLTLCNALDLNIGKRFSVAVCSSLLHEIFSSRGDINDVKKVLTCIRDHLLPGGHLIIRDGIKPHSSQETIFLKPLSINIAIKLFLFLVHYKYLKTPVSILADGRGLIAITQELAYEFAVKYQYEANWLAEMEEQFGFWKEADAREILKETGFEITYLKTYLLDYFKQLFPKDFELFKYENEKFVKLDYPDTHMVIAAKRI